MAPKLVKAFDPLSRATLSERVARRLAARIAAGEWQRGEKLPSEAQLCSAFGIGRSSLREALTSLAFIGLIRVRAGGGSYVAEQPSAYLTSRWLKTGILKSREAIMEFADARLILEAEVAALCAERITDDELKALGELVEQMRAAIGSAEEFAQLDLAFHISIGKAAKNEILNSVLLGIRERTRDLIAKSLLLREGMEQAVAQHTKILEAFRAHSPARAREAMRHHLQSFQRGYSVLFEEHLLEEDEL